MTKFQVGDLVIETFNHRVIAIVVGIEDRGLSGIVLHLFDNIESAFGVTWDNPENFKLLSRAAP